RNAYLPFFFQAEDGIRGRNVTGVQTCALPILPVDARLQLAGEEGVTVALLRTATLPCHMVADEAHRAPCLRARGVETQVAQQPRSEERRVGKECRDRGWRAH